MRGVIRFGTLWSESEAVASERSSRKETAAAKTTGGAPPAEAIGEGEWPAGRRVLCSASSLFLLSCSGRAREGSGQGGGFFRERYDTLPVAGGLCHSLFF
jgi:hypothetical protein